MKRFFWILLGISSTLIGFYPILYFLIDRNFGLLASKSSELLADVLWNAAFYGHIVLGGLALCIGWIQFSAKLRNEHLRLHRRIGKTYVTSVLISGFCGVYIAHFATGGYVSIVGFTCLGIIWLATTLLAYRAVLKGKIKLHQEWMIYSYAVCFAAVTLRVWLPLLTEMFGAFLPAYRIVAWLSWVPNLIVAYVIIRKNKSVASPA
ncbi:MAG: DUF2306 domain-containing protein [Cryomorphaceae bacterium]